ncbi:phosphonate ABC transporter, permease protein PhnE [Terribacillus sp. DMT04]|uniref:phosphonate ABC transporter, permease protein PhnE n=1 Tax=Terribacillus sp. DMT04 TaxID=2850441 RepID=UPI001C2C73B6|nr:phosphonate ABC transporter, permease protein PhnE [Terribacillus sp. DMT04]QXE01259.1 phosphonate ABC transporter, permease protein PhnE [Terribacillus sp. DMT04]
MSQSQTPKKMVPKPPSKLKHYLTAALVIALLVLSYLGTGSSVIELIDNRDQMANLIIEMFPPDWAYFKDIIEPMLETIRMAVIGTTFGAIISIPVILLCANNVNRVPWISYPARFVLNLIRTIPELLLAAIFVAIFGLGMIPGIFALTIFSVGIIAKLTYESVEGIDKGPLEAMTAVGANKFQWIAFSIIPQAAAYFVSYVLYTFEVNVRAAAILGIVGAGGIGLYYDSNLGFFNYPRVNTLIIATLAVVLIIDFVSNKLREKLL